MSLSIGPGQQPMTSGSSGEAGVAIPAVSLAIPATSFGIDRTDEGSTAASEAEDQLGLGQQVASEERSLVQGPSRLGRSRSTASRASDWDEEEEDDEESAHATDGWCSSCRGRCGKGKGSACYWCFVIVFFLFVFEFPIFLKWMLMSPMPIEFWNEGYAKFPALEDQQFIKDEGYSQYAITMSPIPQTWTGCNHSCVGAGGDSSASGEMSFHVDMALNSSGFEHTGFPLLLASNDFSNWWLAADRRDAEPLPFFPNHNADVASAYQHVTEDCTRPPEVTKKGEVSDDIGESFTSQPTYVLVCVAWESQKVNWHRENVKLSLADLGSQCDSIGGVCGWPCGSNPSVHGLQLPGCESGIIKVDKSTGSVAGVDVPNASYSGDVSVKACTDPLGSSKCTTSSEPMPHWPCHRCKNTTINRNASDIELIYDSLPRLEVLLSAALGEASPKDADAAPRAYIMTSPIGPDGLVISTTFKKLYDPVRFPQPKPVSLIEEEEELAGQPTTKAPPALLDESRHQMQFVDRSKVTLKPDKCFGHRGPLYLVACAVNASTYANKFDFVEGQLVAPPPFNDRCLAVSGRCAFACMEQQDPGLPHCTADGFIPDGDLVKKMEVPTNDDTAVKMFVWTLLFGFAVKLVTYFPGLFIPYKHPKYYNPSMTAELKYIAICAPSGGETKACVLRNLIGGFSSLPKGCQCPFHVVFADEGHRHPHKVMFKALVAVLHHVPDSCMNPGSSGPSARQSSRSWKEDNLKTITKLWVEQTRFCTLDGCNTEKIAKKIQSLRKDLPDPSQSTEEIKKLEKAIDDLAGVTALKTLQARSGWPKADASEAIRKLEVAFQQLRHELAVGEKTFDGAGACDKRKPVHLDDCEDHSWPWPSASDPHPEPLYTLHYVARAKPDEDERILKVQHVARGVWYYKIPALEEHRSQKSWRQWRQNAHEFTDGDFDSKKYVVPLRTSRGKAGGLNFVENYLFDYSKQSRPKHALFSIADARHQYQADFMHETIPFFFRKQSRAQRDNGEMPEVDTSVAFTQCPQYYPEMPDNVDYLDTNNSNFFRMNCMLRNCCGGVSSCGTGGTWLIRDRRAGIRGTDSIWDNESVEPMRQGFTQITEYTFFHESCKVEDTASSLDRVVKGRHSQYINRRLSYGMAKDPVDYLAAVQRWAEGGVVLSLQTFFGCEQGIHMIWITFTLFMAFVFSLANLVYGVGYIGLLREASDLLGGDSLFHAMESIAAEQAQWCIEWQITTSVYRDVYTEMFLDVLGWFATLAFAFLVISIVTMISHWFHRCGRFLCLAGKKKQNRRTRFPTSMAQWARLLITMDNLTYFLWFWTAFFWVGFNYYGVYFQRYYHFDATGMVIFSWLMQVLSWSMVISSTCRYRMDQSMAANEVFFLSLTNIWRTTQLFYITAPLTAYSIAMGMQDFLRNRMLGEDISYWVGGDRGAVSKSITQWWTLLLVMAMILTQILFWADYLPNADVVGVLVVTFIGLDVMHPCAFLWLGIDKEPLPKPPASGLPTWQWCLRRCVQIAFCLGFWRNAIRAFVFHPRCSLVIQWIGPIQNVAMPVLTIFYPELGINNALLLLASVK